MNTPVRTVPPNIVVIGGSQGGIEALLEIVGVLPADLAAAIFVVIHLPMEAKSYLPSMLTRAGAIRAAHPADREPIRPGQIYVAPPDFHLTLEDGDVHALKGPRENRHRPAIDPLFRTAARSFGPRVIAVVLSGNLDDGSAGLLAVRRSGGIAIVQDPSSATAGEMPQRALDYAGADFTLPIDAIGPKIVELVHSGDLAMNNPKKHNRERKTNERREKKNGNPSHPEVREHEEDFTSEQGNGKASVFACPECHGVLWEMKEGRLLRFRCRVGHAYTVDSLKSELGESAERAMWAAMRALEEKAAMARRLSTSSNGPKNYLERLNDQADADTANAEVIRGIIFNQTENSSIPDPSKPGERNRAILHHNEAASAEDASVR